MALAALGSSRCPLCSRLHEWSDELVHFPWISGTSKLRLVSDGAAHWDCLKAYNLLDEARELLLDSFGPDGRRPNGNEVSTFSTELRLEWMPRWQMIRFLHARLLVSCSAPASSLQALLPAQHESGERSDFVAQQPGIEFATRTSGVGVVRLTIRTCGSAYLPSDAPGTTVRAIHRTCARSDVEQTLRDLATALRRLSPVEQ